MRTIDVAIVGAGFAGCATAWALARSGLRVVVLEREPELGRHASGRGAGLGRTLAEDDDTSALTIRGAALLRDRFAEAWSPTGGILTFDDPGEAASYASRARALGVPHERVDRAFALRHWPGLVELPIAAAIHAPGDGVIANRTLLAALARDTTVEYGIAVTGVEPLARGVRVATSAGPLEARVVVEAAGAWSGAITGDPPLATVKRHLFTLEAASAADVPYLWHLGAHEVYVRPDGGRVMACPCDAEPTPPLDQQPSADADTRLRDRLDRTGWRPPIAHRWACQRAFAPDRKMKVGRDADRPWLVWAAALGGHGATASVAVGERAAAAVVAAV